MNVNPKIVFFHPYFSDGGVERTNLGLAKILKHHGYDVAFVTIRPTDHFMDDIRELGVEWVELSARSTLRAQPAFARWLHKEKKKYSNPGCKIVVISCQYYVNLACLLFKPFWGKDVRHILSERNHLDEFGVRKDIKSTIINVMVRSLYRYGDQVVANSSELAFDLSVATGRNVKTLYNPTINERLYRLAREEITEDWYLDDHRPCILGVGRLSVQKDFQTLIKAFAKFRLKNDAKLVLLGDGPERDNINKLSYELGVGNDVYMPGFVSNPYKFMSSADLFVLSSVYEGLPNALIEALVLHVPVVSTKCKSGPTEILLNGKLGTLVPVKDEYALSREMLKAFSEDNTGSLFEGDLAEGLKRFEPEEISVKLLELMGELDRSGCH